MSPTLFARIRIGPCNPSLARLVTLLLITLLLVAACSKEDDTEQIRNPKIDVEIVAKGHLWMETNH